jgi:branched-chain amino acid transport system substrate-binding protein
MGDGTRSLRRATALLAVAAIAVVACGSSKKTPAAGGTTAPGVTLKIGFFGSLTGPNSPQLGINEANGVQLAINQYNAKNPATKVTYVPYDSQGDPSIAPSEAQKAITDKVVAIVGPAFSGESKAVLPTFEQAGIVSVTPSATNPTLADHGYKFWHRVVATDAFQAPAEVKWLLKKLNAKKVGVIDDKSDYGKGIADTVRSGVTSGGGTVVSDSIDPKSQDFSSTVNKMHSAGVDGIFYGGYYADLARLLKQLRDGGVTAPIVSDDGAADNKLLASAPTETNTYATCACLIATADPNSAAFVSAYQTAFGAPPGTYSTEAYDAANQLLDAISHGNTTSTTINDYINTHPYKGLSKTITYDAKHEISGGGIDIYQAGSGKLTLLGLVDTLVP